MDTPMNVKSIKEQLVSAEEHTSKNLHHLGTKASLIASRAQVGFLKASAQSREMIHRRPLTAVLAGIGAGCVLGGLTGLIIGRKTGHPNHAIGLDEKTKSEVCK